jgi:uncharacterized protein
MSLTKRGFLAALVGLGFAAAAAPEASAQQQLSIVTGGTGGVYYPLGGGFANIIGKKIPGFTASAQVTGGSVANLELLGRDKADMGFSQVDAAWDAVNGLDKFKSGKLDIKALVVMYPNHMQVVTVEGSGVTKIEDMKGKRISTGSAGSATEVFAFRVLEAAGLDPQKDIVRERLGAAESANAMKDKKIDAFFFVAGLPTAAITDLAATPGTKIKVIDIAQYAPKMIEKYGAIYSASVIPKSVYPGMDADAKNVAVWNILVVNGKMSNDLAYNLTKVMMESREDLGQVHAEGKNILDSSQTIANAGIPIHPGALKYFQEKGLKVQ